MKFRILFAAAMMVASSGAVVTGWWVRPVSRARTRGAGGRRPTHAPVVRLLLRT